MLTATSLNPAGRTWRTPVLGAAETPSNQWSHNTFTAASATLVGTLT